ncbi:MAG: hypothetical protein QXN93_06845 [Methanomassiliicoccales archaeon]
MENKKSYKECPRCGLRNKIYASECDFCGWEFNDVSDEWAEELIELERLASEKSSERISREESKIVEATLVRNKERIQLVSKRVENDVLEPTDVIRDASPITSEITAEPVENNVAAAEMQSVTEVQQITAQPKPEAGEQPVIHDTKEQEITRSGAIDISEITDVIQNVESGIEEFFETMTDTEPKEGQQEHEAATIAPMEPSSHKDVFREYELTSQRVEEELVEKSAKPADGGFCRIFGHRRGRLSISFIIFGFSIYTTAILVEASASLGWIIGWSLSIAGSAIAAIGCVVAIYIVCSRKFEHEGTKTMGIQPYMEKDETDIIICPVCHEVVSEDDEVCPCCGVEFEISGTKGMKTS